MIKTPMTDDERVEVNRLRREAYAAKHPPRTPQTREEKLAQKRENYRLNRERLIDVARSRYEDKREEILAKHKERRHGDGHEQWLAVAKSYRERNADKIRAKDKERAQELDRRLSIRLRVRLDVALRRHLDKQNKGRGEHKRTISAVRDLGCSLPDFIEYMTALFKPGMTWDNWGEWHIDHKIPLVSFDLTKPELVAKACHYTNLQPLWAFDNLSKGVKVS